MCNELNINMKISICSFLKWLMILGGIGMGAAAGVLYYKNRENTGKLEVTKVTPKNDNTSKTEKSWPPTMNISTIQAASVPPNLDKN